MQSLDTKAEFKSTESLAQVVKRLGNPESAILLHSPCSVFQIPQVDGIIGYQKVGNCAVVIGDPICLPHDVAALIDAFHLHCRESHLKVVYFLVHHDFAHWAIDNGCHTLIQVGEEMSINPSRFQERQKLRWKINQARQHGVTINEYKNADPELENQIRNTVHTWLKERHGPQIHLGNIDFSKSDGSRIFYAQKNDRIVGLALLSPLDRIQGWVVSAYFAILEAPVGTTEHLMCSTFESLAHENSHFLCLGVVSGSKIGEVTGLSPTGKFLANFIFRMAKWVFKLDARAAYLNKYHPHSRPTFLLSREKLSLEELFAIKNLLNVKL